jgi:hypothetical protein
MIPVLLGIVRPLSRIRNKPEESKARVANEPR